MKVNFNYSLINYNASNVIKPFEANKQENHNKQLKELGFDSNGYYNRISFAGKITNNPNSKHSIDHYTGCLIGGAIGDALGAPVEFTSLPEIRKNYGPYGIREYLLKDNKKAEFTDDTQMTIFTADGLIKSALKNHSIQNIDFLDVFESYGDWLSTQRNNKVDKGWLTRQKKLYKVKAPGNTCISALINGEAGTLKNRINDSKGNGGIMRVAPVGLLYYNNPSKAFNIGVGCCALTHSKPEAYLSAGAMASIIAYIIKGENIEEAVKQTIKILERKNNNENVTNALKTALHYAKTNLLEEDVIPSLGHGWTGEEALAISVYSALKNSNNFSKAIECAVNITGDSDTVGAITGNIMGAYLGEKKIPQKYKNKLEAKTLLKNLAKDLYVMPNRIKNKAEKYPVSYSIKKPLTLNEILGENYKVTKPVINKSLLKKIKQIPNVNIFDYKDFFRQKDMSTNEIENIILPVSMINKETKSKIAFDKMLYSLTEHLETLREKENKRMLWKEDTVQADEFLWQIYGLIVNNDVNTDDLFNCLVVMLESEKYSLKDISDFLETQKSKPTDYKKLSQELLYNKDLKEIQKDI